MDLILLYALDLSIREPMLKRSDKLTIFVLGAFNVGLLMVDHIHFQYNGVMLGLLILCIVAAKESRYGLFALLFSMLVMSKHLFLTLAPVVAIYLLRIGINQAYVTSNINNASNKTASVSLLKFVSYCLKILVCALLPVIIALAPFLLLPFIDLNSTSNNTATNKATASPTVYSAGMQQMQQILSRLFPFARGLVHAYWAPNIWALYCFADKILSIFFPNTLSGTLPSSTAGIVGDFQMVVLPRVTGLHCAILVLLFQLPALWMILIQLNKATSALLLIRSMVFASFTAFMLGYHVHEKAILIPWMLQTLTAVNSPADASLFMLLSAAGSVSLFPLLPGPFECAIKMILTLVYVFVARYYLLHTQLNRMATWAKIALNLILFALMVTAVYTEMVHDWLLQGRLPFLPLMMTSVVCAAVLVLAWILSWYNLCWVSSS